MRGLQVTKRYDVLGDRDVTSQWFSWISLTKVSREWKTHSHYPGASIEPWKKPPVSKARQEVAGEDLEREK
jgi:hypothetical protein